MLEQVSQLFADHPDLLMEFTYFLPDAVQEQVNNYFKSFIEFIIFIPFLYEYLDSWCIYFLLYYPFQQ